MKTNLITIFLLLNISSFGQVSNDTLTTETNESVFTKKASIVSFDDKYKIGFYLGYGISNYSLKTNDLSQTSYKDSLISVTSGRDFSTMELGIYLENSVTNRIAIRSKLVLLYDAVDLNYKKPSGNETLKLENVAVCIPVHIVCQTKGTNSRGYFVFGPSLAFGLSSESKIADKITAKAFDIPVEIGIGFYKRFKKFFISPEIKLSQGILDLNGHNQTFYSQSINKLTRQNIVFALTISGH